MDINLFFLCFIFGAAVIILLVKVLMPLLPGGSSTKLEHLVQEWPDEAQEKADWLASSFAYHDDEEGVMLAMAISRHLLKQREEELLESVTSEE